MGHMERHHRKYLVGVTAASVITAAVACIGWSNSSALLDVMTKKYSFAVIDAARYQEAAYRITVTSINSNIACVLKCDSLKLELLKCRNRRPGVPAIPTKKPCKVVCTQTPLKPGHTELDNHVLPHTVVCDTTSVPKQKCVPGLYENLMGRLPITGRYPDSGGGVWNGVWKDCK